MWTFFDVLQTTCSHILYAILEEYSQHFFQFDHRHIKHVWTFCCKYATQPYKGLTFSSRLSRLKRLHRKILSWQREILAVKKRDPILLGWNFLHVITGCNLWRVYNTGRIEWHGVWSIFKMFGKHLIISDILSGIWKFVISIPVLLKKYSL